MTKTIIKAAIHPKKKHSLNLNHNQQVTCHHNRLLKKHHRKSKEESIDEYEILTQNIQTIINRQKCYYYYFFSFLE